MSRQAATRAARGLLDRLEKYLGGNRHAMSLAIGAQDRASFRQFLRSRPDGQT
ncbi:MAG: hypothetical protein WCC08_03825 [Terrimicrobiaceae bacterium]